MVRPAPMFVLAAFTFLVTPAAVTRGEPGAPAIDLWPGKAPSETTEIGPEHLQETKPGQLDVKRLTNVSRPTLTLYKAPKESNTGAAVIVAPGGGFSILAIEHEGTQVCEWLNSIGVNAVLLKYRVPRRPDQPREGAPLHALQDAQRAVGIVRGRAAEWGIDPKRIGMLGFSAGAHLAAAAATNYDKRAYDAVDSADEASGRPDFVVLIYPGGMLNADRSALLPHLRVTARTPPMFFAHAHDDPVPAENSVHALPRPEAAQGARRAARLRQGRPRLRHAPQQQPHRRLAAAVCRVDEGPGVARRGEVR